MTDSKEYQRSDGIYESLDPYEFVDPVDHIQMELPQDLTLKFEEAPFVSVSQPLIDALKDISKQLKDVVSEIKSIRQEIQRNSKF